MKNVQFGGENILNEFKDTERADGKSAVMVEGISLIQEKPSVLH